MIRTKRLLLRPAMPSDVAPLHDIFSDPKAMRYWSCLPHDLDQTQAFVDGMISADPAASLERVVVYNHQVIGRVGLWRIAEIGFIFHPRYWGLGLAREAVGALVDAVFARFPGIDRIDADIDPRNAGSERLLLSLGFVETGRAANTLKLGEEWCDSTYFARDRPRL